MVGEHLSEPSLWFARGDYIYYGIEYIGTAKDEVTARFFARAMKIVEFMEEHRDRSFPPPSTCWKKGRMGYVLRDGEIMAGVRSAEWMPRILQALNHAENWNMVGAQLGTGEAVVEHHASLQHVSPKKTTKIYKSSQKKRK